MPNYRAGSAKFRKYRATVLSVLMHALVLTGLIVTFDRSPLTASLGVSSNAFMIVAEHEVVDLPPWPINDDGQLFAAKGAHARQVVLSGDVPLLQTNNGFAVPDATVQLPAAADVMVAQQPVTMQQQVIYGHFDPTLFAAPAHHEAGNATESTVAAGLPAAQKASQTALTGSMTAEEILKGRFRVRIVTTRDNAYVVVEISGGDIVMRSLLDETARRYNTNTHYSDNSTSYAGSFTAPVLAALP